MGAATRPAPERGAPPDRPLIFDEWRMAHQAIAFWEWLEQGAPSDNSRPDGPAS